MELDDIDMPTEDQLITVLLVDDEEPVRETTQAMLEVSGYEVLTASDGIEALEIYASMKDNINIILLDMSMPNMSGRDTLFRLLEINPAVKVIISSGFEIDGPVKELIKIGAKSALQKPYRMQDMVNLISKILDD